MRAPATVLLPTMLLAASLLAAPVAWAQSADASLDEHMAKKYKKNLSGWPGGIVFVCTTVDRDIAVIRDLCIKATTNAEFLAAAARIKFKKLEPGNLAGFLSAMDGGALGLELELKGTKDSKSLSAMLARLRAWQSYDEAVDTSTKAAKSGRNKARSGELVFWDNDGLGATTGLPKDLGESMSSNIDHLLKAFFAEYIRAQQ